MPAVDLLLQLVATREQGGVLRRQIADQDGQAGPERFWPNASAQQRLSDEVVQFACDVQPCSLDPIHAPPVSYQHLSPGLARLYAGVSGIAQGKVGRAAERIM